MEQRFNLAIILPIYNPYRAWEIELENSLNITIKAFEGYTIQFILVNDGTSDDISNAVDKLLSKFNSIKYIQYPINKGKGHAIRTGLKQVIAENYIYYDWDFPFGETILLSFFYKLKNESVDLVIANRTGNYYEKLPFIRKLISISLRFFSLFFLSFGKYDSQAGLKGLSEKGKNVFMETKINDFIFELEFIKLAIKKRLSISKIDVSVKPTIKLTNFKFKVLKTEITHLFKLLI